MSKKIKQIKFFKQIKEKCSLPLMPRITFSAFSAFFNLFLPTSQLGDSGIGVSSMNDTTVKAQAYLLTNLQSV
jgi:hypothetical protein